MTIKQQQKNATAHIQQWENSTIFDIFQAYDRPSIYKQYAWNYCLDTCQKHNGYNLRIISYNSSIFTAGFEYVHPETGCVMFYYITPNYDVAVDCLY